MNAPDNDRPKPVARVLVADDNDLCRSLVVGILERMGCRVDAVEHGAAAVAAAAKTRYDLIFLDGIMPHMDGIEATRAIRELPGANGRVPIVGITGNPVQIPKGRCLEAGMNEYLQKPISTGAYKQAVARWVLNRQAPAPREGARR